jgi:hypothetical protein
MTVNIKTATIQTVMPIRLGWHIGTIDRLCGLVVTVLDYRSEGPGSIPGTTRK